MKQCFVLSLAVIAAFLGLCTLVNVQTVHAEEVKPAKILLFTRSQGHEHEPARWVDNGTGTGRILNAYFRAYDKNIEIVETQDGRVFDGDIDQYDAFVFYTSGNLLGGVDANHEKIQRNAAFHPMTEAGLRKMIAAIRAGKGFVGIHAATDTHCGIMEDGVDIFTRLVGARFTGHGPDQYAKLTVVQPTTTILRRYNLRLGRSVYAEQTVVQPTAIPFLKGKGKQFTFFDEWYGMNHFNTDMHVVLIQETEGMRGRDYERPPYPMTWLRKEGEGRAAYTSVGHNNRYLNEIAWLVSDLIEWSIGRFNADTTPNIETVTPRFREMPPPRQQQ